MVTLKNSADIIFIHDGKEYELQGTHVVLDGQVVQPSQDNDERMLVEADNISLEFPDGTVASLGTYGDLDSDLVNIIEEMVYPT